MFKPTKRCAILVAATVVAAAAMLGTPAVAVEAEELTFQERQQIQDDLQSLIDNSRRLLTRFPGPQALHDDLDHGERLLQTGLDDDFLQAPPQYREELRRFSAILEKLVDVTERSANPTERDWIDDPAAFPEADYPHLEMGFLIQGNTQDRPSGGSGSGSESGNCNESRAMSAAEKLNWYNATLAAEGGRDILVQVCKTFFEPACIPVHIAFIVFHGIVDNLMLCDAFVGQAEITGTYHRLGHLHGDIGGMKSDVVDRLGQMQIALVAQASETDPLLDDVGADLDKHDAAMAFQAVAAAGRLGEISTLLEELRREDMRMEIEAGLADGDVPVAWHWMPAELGGQLELVHQLVAGSIASLEAAGQSVDNAHAMLARAESYMAVGDWTRAHEACGRAYRAAAAVGDGDDDDDDD